MPVHLHEDVREYIRSGDVSIVWIEVLISDLKGRPSNAQERVEMLSEVYRAIRQEGVDIYPGNMDPHNVFLGYYFYLRGQGYRVARAVTALGNTVNAAIILQVTPVRLASLQAMVGA